MLIAVYLDCADAAVVNRLQILTALLKVTEAKV